MKLRIAVVVLLSLANAGCLTMLMSANCFDAGRDRNPRAMNGYFVVELRYRDQEPLLSDIHCEEYYDAMCSERGNYWSWREVGTANGSQRSMVTVFDPETGEIIVGLPTCKSLVGGEPDLTINGELRSRDSRFVVSAEFLESSDVQQ